MPTLTIDDRTVTVAPGTRVIDAAEHLGIMIPRFCFHPALGSVGACRVCAVKVVEGPRTGIQMSCMIDAADGMVVSTTDAEAVDFRRHVIEWLMLNHPHDCPVCDEGGHCLLQDTTIAGGHGLRRYAGAKRTHRNQYLGPLVEHEMNRCIQCYRCTRFYREFAGYTDLGVRGIGSRVYFGRQGDGILESPFAGNLIDICPTGVFTDRPSRHKGRRWEFERGASVCIHCCLGCATVTSARYRSVVRQEARFHPAVNGHFICDRGRFGFDYANDPQRPRSARVDRGRTSARSAAAAAADRIAGISERHGPGAVAVAGGRRSSLETLAGLAHLCASAGHTGPSVFTDADTARKTRAALAGLGPLTALSPADLASADFVLAVGADPVNEAPMLAMALRQAWRGGAEIVVMDPRPVRLPFGFHHIPVHPDALAGTLAGALKQAAAGMNTGPLSAEAADWLKRLPDQGPVPRSETARAATGLARSRRPAIVCGTDVCNAAAIDLAGDAAHLLAALKNRAGVLFLLHGANAAGAAWATEDEAGFDGIVAGIEAGAIRGLVLVETDPCRWFADPDRLDRALDRLELLVVTDNLDTPPVRRADIFVPSLTVFESGGLFVNAEGRAQRAAPVFAGGRPIAQTGGGGHPPRTFRPDIPDGDGMPAWRFAAALCGRGDAAGPEAAFQCLARFPDPAHFPSQGLLLDPVAAPEVRFRNVPREAAATPPDRFRVLTVDLTFGTERLSRSAPCLTQLTPRPELTLHPDDAAELGLGPEDTALMDAGGEPFAVPVCLDAAMARGVLVIPRHDRLPWRRFGSGPGTVDRGRIRKAAGDAPC